LDWPHPAAPYCASSVAKRIAEELNTPLGEVVGYKVRFQDTLQKGMPRSS
jgi:HrpA-like helicases